jgi:S-DNA-T family DNA segregation ATPase FtsK/SpoIIIE
MSTGSHLSAEPDPAFLAGKTPYGDQPPPGPSRGRLGWQNILVLGPLAAGAVYAVGLLAATTHPKVFAAAVVAVAAAGCAVLAALFTTGPTVRAGWWSACGAVAACWVAYAAVAGAGTWIAVAALLVPTAAAIRLWSMVRVRERGMAEAERRRKAESGLAVERKKWPALLARIGYEGVTFVRREDTLCGYSVLLSLPSTGHVTYSQLAHNREKLEVAARTRHGSLRFERGQAAHEVILHVAERDVLAETVPLPAGSRRLTITKPIEIGVHEDGQVCSLTLREVASLIVGLRGSGKSNLLNVLIAQLARCEDVLIFVIDQKGGRMAAPWLDPWLSGKTPAPVIDWLATTREEAEVMLRACLRGIDARSRSGSGGEKIVPSSRQPAVMLIVDEAAVIFGLGTGGPRSTLEGTTNTQLAALGTQITMLGRSEAIDPVFATQRGTVTMTGSGDLKSQCGLRIGLGVASEADARLIIPDDVHIAADLATLAHPGSGIVQLKQGRVTPVKFFRLEHDEIGPIAERTGWIRPRPDPLLAEALGEDYATRWERAGHLSQRDSRPVAHPVAVAAPHGATDAAFQAIIAESGLAAHPRSAQPRPAQPQAAQPQSAQPQSAQPRAPHPRAPHPQAVHPRSPQPRSPQPQAAQPHAAQSPAAQSQAASTPARRRMREYIRRHGARGVTPAMICHLLASEDMAVTLPSIGRWLAEDEAAGLVERGTLGRWRHRD